MPVDKLPCFIYDDHQVFMITLINARGTRLVVTNYGGIIMSLELKLPDGTTNDLVLGFDSAAGYRSPEYLGLEASPYFGAIIGRVANRIAGGSFELDGIKYQLARNLPPEHLHGGVKGFDQRVWTIRELNDHPHPALTLGYVSPAGEENYPGTLTASVRYELSNDDELSITYTASTDQPTLFNPTNHTYFNLNREKNTVADHILQIPSKAILDQDEHYTPTGGLVPVEETMYDFREAKLVGRDWNPAKGYDQSFVLDQREDASIASIHSPSSGIAMEVFSDAPVIHFYTGSGINNIRGKGGFIYEPFSGFSLETQIHPNAINIAGFPDTVLRPGKPFFSKTTYRFSRVK